MDANTTGGGATKVLIVDDHPAVREGLATRIARHADLELCGEAEDIQGALRAIEERQPQVVVVDIALGNENGLDLIRRIRARGGDVRILVWSMYPESHYAARALRAGANGYITKRQATGDIVAAIRVVRDGKVFLSDETAARLLQRSAGGGRGESSPADALSDRELEVFELIGQGLRTSEIAARLHVSVNTVETHRQRIKTKLGLRSGPELGRVAAQWNLEEPSP